MACTCNFNFSTGGDRIVSDGMIRVAGNKATLCFSKLGGLECDISGIFSGFPALRKVSIWVFCSVRAPSESRGDPNHSNRINSKKRQIENNIKASLWNLPCVWTPFLFSLHSPKAPIPSYTIVELDFFIFHQLPFRASAFVLSVPGKHNFLHFGGTWVIGPSLLSDMRLLLPGGREHLLRPMAWPYLSVRAFGF